MRVAAQSQHWRVLEQQQDIAYALLMAQLHKFRLQPQALVVAHTPEIEVLNHRYLDCSQPPCKFIGAAFIPQAALQTTLQTLLDAPRQPAAKESSQTPPSQYHSGSSGGER